MLRLLTFCLITALLPTKTYADESESPPPLSNTIRWSTASEVENFGYDVYRGLAEEGPFERITEDPIPGAGTTDTPSRYSFVDDTIAPADFEGILAEARSLQKTRIIVINPINNEIILLDSHRETLKKADDLFESPD